MQKDFEQIKLNVPKTNTKLIEYCRRLSARRQLSATVIRLLNKEMKSQEELVRNKYKNTG